MEGCLGYKITNHQFSHLLDIIAHDYKLYLPQKLDGKITFDEFARPSDVRIFDTTTIPFKKYLFPNHQSKNIKFSKPIALAGLHNCDVAALDLFYDQFKNSDILINRKNLFIIGTSCTPDKDCFCNVFGADKLGKVDIYLQKEIDGMAVFPMGIKAKKYFDKLGVKSLSDTMAYRPIKLDRPQIDIKTIPEIVDQKKMHQDFWQGIANNCFGCGACTVVCPLCFCFRQDYKNNVDGSESQCTNWDSCFAKEFSEVQNHCDIRPENVDRLYNWYHHKFVRAEKELKKPLCVGCGRCIKACPAHLNIKNILHSLEEQSK